VGPSPDHEYLILQTLVGTWPITPDRVVEYVIKAAREGKRETHWLGGDSDYEADLAAFVRALFDDAAFVASLETFVDRVREPGRLTSLSQALLELTSPGVPDVYQGSELWNLSLVDPDNRRPVDFARRARMLAGLRRDTEPEDVLAGLDAGLPKLWVHHQALTVRRRHPDAFAESGGYEALWALGSRADHVVAFVRGTDVVTVAPCRVVALGATFLAWDWDDTTLQLPAGRWRDVMSDTVHDGASAPMSRLLNRFPVALLVREDEGAPTA
jgi:(1->4)-alpha-D-glucan 1-alpha-D-glucosylmutase